MFPKSFSDCWSIFSAFDPTAINPTPRKPTIRKLINYPRSRGAILPPFCLYRPTPPPALWAFTIDFWRLVDGIRWKKNPTLVCCYDNGRSIHIASDRRRSIRLNGGGDSGGRLTDSIRSKSTSSSIGSRGFFLFCFVLDIGSFFFFLASYHELMHKHKFIFWFYLLLTFGNWKMKFKQHSFIHSKKPV